MNRAQYMSPAQKALWKAAEEKEARWIPRSHENCRRILGRFVTVTDKETGGKRKVYYPGVARPGKTAKDRANRK